MSQEAACGFLRWKTQSELTLRNTVCCASTLQYVQIASVFNNNAQTGSLVYALVTSLDHKQQKRLVKISEAISGVNGHITLLLHLKA